VTTKASSPSPSAVAYAREDWPHVFEAHVNAGDLEGVIALYAPDASFVPASGDAVVGRDEIRRRLAPFIAGKAQFQAQV
jgi:uncharacterized protein (TIGR02246 family)